MEIVQLRIVREIHAAGSLSKASMRLNKAQSIVSRHLAAFEKECGGRVFHRNGRGVEPTELGRKVLPQIEVIIAAMDEMIDCGRVPVNEIAGDVRLSISSAICERFVPALYAAVRAEHPLIRLQLFEGYSNEIDQALDHGATDIAIFLSNGSAVRPNEEAICQFDTCLVGQPGDPAVQRPEILFSELEGLPLLLPSRPSLARHSISELAASRGLALNIVAEVNSPGSTSALFKAGAGYLVTPVGVGSAACLGHIGRQIAKGQLGAARIRDPDLKRTLVVSSPASASARVEVVRKAAVRILREQAKSVGFEEAARPAA